MSKKTTEAGSNAVKSAPAKTAAVRKTAAASKKENEAKKSAPCKKTACAKAAAARKTAAAKKVENEPVAKVAETQESTIDIRKIKPHSVEKQTKSPVTMTSERPANVGVPASVRSKKRLVVSYQNMNEALAEAFQEKYPKGYADYMGDLFKVDKPDGTSFYAISMETEDAVYLIKMVVRIDKIEDAQAGLFPDVDGVDGGDGDTFPDTPVDTLPDHIADPDDDVD